MKTYAMTLNLKDDPALIAEYKKHHEAVWPEVIASLKAVGVEGMQIYLHGRTLFMTVQTVDDFDPDTNYGRYLTLSPRCPEWEALMDKYQERLPGTGPDEKWVYMDNIFDMK